jgi:hypothetical protein
MGKLGAYLKIGEALSPLTEGAVLNLAGAPRLVGAPEPAGIRRYGQIGVPDRGQMNQSGVAVNPPTGRIVVRFGIAVCMGTLRGTLGLCPNDLLRPSPAGGPLLF